MKTSIYTRHLFQPDIIKRAVWLRIAHGPHAMIETQRAFYLVPWENHHAQKWDKRIKGRVLSGGGIDWDTGRSRGIGR